MPKKDAAAEEKTCPKCSSQDSGYISKILDSNKTPQTLRKCFACGTVWRPAPSKGLALAYILLGTFCLVTFLGVTAATNISFNIIILGFGVSPIHIFCVLAIIWGVLILMGVAGKKQIVLVVNRPPPKEQEPKPTMTGQAPKPEPGEKECPYCGKRYPGSATVCPLDMQELVEAEKDATN